MSEPNVLLLDKFEYALDSEEYQDSCEMLKLDNRLREKLRLPLRCESLIQPYIRIKEDVRDHKLRLRAYFDSSAELSDCCLALEEAAHCVCVLNGQPVDMRPQGYYVDPAISVVKLPVIKRGRNTLCVEMEYGDCTDLEWMYVLGDFGVELRGAHTSLCKKPERLFWGDYTRQGFPFYTGNMTYVVRLPEMPCEDGLIQIPYYSGAAVKISSSAAANLAILNLLFLICCIPIITAGPAITAMNYVVFKMRMERDIPIAKSFFKSFRQNLRQGVILWLLMGFSGITYS